MRLAAASAAVLLVLVSCGISTVTTEGLLRHGELYASRISFGWQNLSVFQLRGNARLQGSNLVARGPFVLWGRVSDNRLRGDFYGPDGKPVLSLSADSSGILIYMPQDEHAVFMPGGLRTGYGTVLTEDLIFLIRTGFPLLLESWMIADGARTDDGSIQWSFTLPDSMDTMVLTMENGDLFPSSCMWNSGEFEISAASPHDEYRAWPWEWLVSISDNRVSLELTEINTPEVPFEGIWDMTVPIPVDTLGPMPSWQPSWRIIQR